MRQLQKHYQEIINFNLQAGNRFEAPKTFEFYKALRNQLKLVQEELTEVVNAVEHQDDVEILDGIADVMVTMAWVFELAHQAGFEVDKAMRAVNENNSTKIFKSYIDAAKTAEYYADQGIEGMHVEESLVQGVPYYTARDQNKKIRKPIGFKSVELSQFVPT